ncbi:MAG: cobalamin-dependent protein [Leptospirales bacterium]|nr:cobalamin-dependent protein [Leptospirales bacterium]
MTKRKKILIVGTHFDVTRLPLRRPGKYPMAMGTVYLAGAFNENSCDVRCYNEVVSGPLTDESLLSWPDMVVLTGLSVSFDRMLHITAHVKSRNPAAIVVAGGPAVRILKNFSRSFFDYVCTGDVEEMKDVIADSFGEGFVAPEMLPRMDLAYWINKHAHLETSRYCNFACSFCSLTGEGGKYQKYDPGYLRAQLELIHKTGNKYSLHFVDNNFYGNDREFFKQRISVISEYHKKGYFKYWTALLTGDFYLSEENLALAAGSGCAGFFTGIESFDAKSLRGYNKLQNMKLPQVELMRRSLNHGLVIFYGLFADVYNRSLDDIRTEMDFLFSNHEMMMPSFVTLPIPLIGTPYFRECLERDLFLPNTKLRDLDGSTLSMKPLDDMDEVVAFVRSLQDLQPFRGALMRHALGFYKRYRKTLSLQRMLVALAPNALLAFNRLMTGNGLRKTQRLDRTHVSSTEGLDPCYTPSFRIESRYEKYFQPTMLTDSEGRLSEQLWQDIERTGMGKVEPVSQTVSL